MNRKIMEVVRRMQDYIDEEQLRQLKSTLDMVFTDCEIVKSNTELMLPSDSWRFDMEDFLADKSLGGKSGRTTERYRYELNRLLSYINKAVDDVTSKDISDYMKLYKEIRKVSNSTLKNVRSVYSSFFGWLADNDRIMKNPMSQVTEVKVEFVKKEPYTDEEMELLFRNCKTLRDKAMMEFLYSTAVRVSELASINISDVRFATQDLIVFGKGGKERLVYLNDRSNLYLKEYLESRKDNNPALFVGLRKPHNRLTKEGIEAMIRRTGERAGVHKAVPHKFRRTAITNLLNRGMPVQEAMEYVGHSDPKTTMMYGTMSQESVKFHHKKYLSA